MPTDPSQDLDVDARFLLANERTLLAWLRTGLALIAFGAAAGQLPDVQHRGPVTVVLVLAGMLATVAGAVRYRSADLALRAGRLPATGRTPYAVVAVVLVTAVVLLVASLA